MTFTVKRVQLFLKGVMLAVCCLHAVGTSRALHIWCTCHDMHEYPSLAALIPIAASIQEMVCSRPAVP